jgi:hypothetical protein
MLSIRIVAEKIRTFTAIEINNYIHFPYLEICLLILKLVEKVFSSISQAQCLKFDRNPTTTPNNVTIQLPSGLEKFTVYFNNFLVRRDFPVK